MATTETEFIDAAKRLVEVYQRKVKRLQSIIADWESDASAQLNLLPTPQEPHRNGKATLGTSIATPRPESPKPKKVSEWIRFAVEQNQEHVTSTAVLNTVLTANPAMAAKVKPARVSTGLYQLAKAGELEVVEKVPGKASTYRITAKFQPWARFKRVKREVTTSRQTLLAESK
jgi:hypothetical protein